jgi:hypothetical protein
MTEQPGPIAYLTDVEGLWQKLLGFLDGNPYVRLGEGGRLEVADGATFVFGGDAIDRGPGARRIVRLLVEAKRRQPAQVVLLAGNRDINKLRLPRELTGLPPQRTPAEIREASRGELLRWIFDNTMGASKAFACRRAELELEGRDACDEGVVESYLEDMGPDGSMRHYLAACQLAYRAGPTLFVHGGVTAQSLGRVPGTERAIDGVDAWVERLNAWYDGQIDAFLRNVISPSGTPAWAPLVAYQAPLPGTRLNQASVVYGRPSDDEGNPFLPEQDVIEALQRSGVRRLLVGHTPIGDSPALLRQPGFELVAADNSYSPVETGSRLYVLGDHVECEAEARLAVGPDAAASPAPSAGADTHRSERVRFRVGLDDDSAIGLRLEGSGHLVKGELASGEFLICRSLPGFKIDQRAVSSRELREHRLVPPRR